MRPAAATPQSPLLFIGFPIARCGVKTIGNAGARVELLKFLGSSVGFFYAVYKFSVRKYFQRINSLSKAVISAPFHLVLYARMR